jgi:glycosyltransferase involved in cell wall biosynthesis
VTLLQPAELFLSVIIPARNAERTVGDQLDALSSEAPSFQWEILIADNASTDSTPQIIAEFLARCPVARSITISEAANASQVRNQAVPHARGNALAFVDADDVIGPGWVSKMGEAVAHHPLVCARQEYRELNPGWLVQSRGQTQTNGLSTLFGYPVVSIGNSACQRWVWEALGGLDDQLYAGEDNDFSIRAYKRLGIEPLFVAGAVLHYRFRRRIIDIVKQAHAYGRGEPYLYKKYGSEAGLRRGRVAIRAYFELLELLFLIPFGRRYRARFAWVLGKRLGRLQGSLVHRVFYF